MTNIFGWTFAELIFPSTSYKGIMVEGGRGYLAVPKWLGKGTAIYPVVIKFEFLNEIFCQK